MRYFAGEARRISQWGDVSCCSESPAKILVLNLHGISNHRPEKCTQSIWPPGWCSAGSDAGSESQIAGEKFAPAEQKSPLEDPGNWEHKGEGREEDGSWCLFLLFLSVCDARAPSYTQQNWASGRWCQAPYAIQTFEEKQLRINLSFAYMNLNDNINSCQISHRTVCDFLQ